ncbi:MAG: potassium transporter TrkG [Erythrobacter sp.]
MTALRDPVRVIPLLFLVAIAAGTALLWLPVASADGTQTSLLTAFFTATSAISVTGLIVVDTPTYWSFFGQVVILALFQIGGFGIMSAATIFGLIAGRGFDLRARMATYIERSRLAIGDARSVLFLVLSVTLIVEAVVALILSARLALGHGYDWPSAIWHGVFHSVSAFNNAGFSSYSDSVMGFQSDALMLVPIMISITIATVGFPVLQDLRANGLGWKRDALHSKITLAGTAALLLLGFAAMLGMEWSNPATLGPTPVADKLLNAAFHSAMPRTAGFNSLDVGALRDETVLFNYVLMFIGGGSAGTAGGIKITTVALLFVILIYQVRGLGEAEIEGRRVSNRLASQAVTVIMFALTVIFVATFYLSVRTPHSLTDISFESISAFATVGLSRGITGPLPVDGQLVIVALMWIGRVGTITAATWLALGARGKGSPPRNSPKEPIIG